ncbi:unnamed protein product [Eruca vesicaria subsp. sativa]|uniref:Uncharacterized protein n=1 Tax=Eruca vesicaria subsp. sativa TaxID=29727 RepID=A0ABC8LX43_ERUVS|nr:unnamed protein product [Eruca vesicaria subsp. sativa]
MPLFLFRTWTPPSRPLASSCLISLLHGVSAAYLAANALISDPTRGFSSPNTLSQNSVLDFSSAYFLADLLHLAVFPSPAGGDGLFAAVLFFFLTCRIWYLTARALYSRSSSSPRRPARVRIRGRLQRCVVQTCLSRRVCVGSLRCRFTHLIVFVGAF